MTNRNHDAGASKNSTKSPLTPKSRYTIAPSDTQAHRRLSRSVTHEVLIKKKKEENLCETWMYDWWDTSCYFAVRFNPIAKYLPIWISLRTGKDMRELVKNARLDIPVTYDDYSNVINTMLLMSALFLAFVAASVTLLGPDDYLEMDLLYCKRGWAHEQTCHDLDVAGFFGETNATGFILPAEANATLASVDVRPMVYNMWKVVWGDSLYPTRGWDIPSFSIMYNSMLSMGCLIIIVMTCFFQYLTLLMSGAQNMGGGNIMQAYYRTGVPLFCFQWLCLMASTCFWATSMNRVIGGMFPAYIMSGYSTMLYTSSDDEGDYAFISSAISENVLIGPLLLFGWPAILFQFYCTFAAEKNYVLGERPKHIADFIHMALNHLDENDFQEALLRQKQKSEQQDEEDEKDISEFDGNRPVDGEAKAAKDTKVEDAIVKDARVEDAKVEAVHRVSSLFEDQGFVVGFLKTDNEGELTEEDRKKQEQAAIDEMDHFIVEFKHLRWDDFQEKLSSREHACLQRLHQSLYPLEWA